MSIANLVMIPGLNCTGRLYEAQGAALAEDFAVSVARHGRHMTMREDAAAILTDAPERFVLMGLSMGGYLAFEIMRQAPARVERLILMDTSARADTPEQSERRRSQIERTEAGGFGEICEELYPRLVHPSRIHDAALKQVVDRMARDTGPDRFVTETRAIMGRADSRPLLAAITCPTLVLVGAEDALTPPELAREIADGIAGARLVVVRESGHLPTLERPETVNAEITAWLGVKDATGAR